MKKVFKADQEYLDNMKSYTMKDTCFALIYFFFVMAALYVMGRIQTFSGKYYGEILAVISIFLVLLLARFKFTKIGISRRGLIPGVVTGLVMGMIFILIYTIIPGIRAGSELLPAKEIAYNIFYYFIIIAFEEEISFRGFITPRLYPLFKNEWITLLAGGILFALMHYPYQMAARNMNVIEYFPIFISSVPILFLWHYVCSWLYRRFGNVWGSTVIHGFIDMSMGIFG